MKRNLLQNHVLHWTENQNLSSFPGSCCPLSSLSHSKQKPVIKLKQNPSQSPGNSLQAGPREERVPLSVCWHMHITAKCDWKDSGGMTLEGCVWEDSHVLMTVTDVVKSLHLAACLKSNWWIERDKIIFRAADNMPEIRILKPEG